MKELAWRSAISAAQWAAVAVGASAMLSNRLYAMQRRVDAAERFGQYALEEKIGEGGMGVVYRARHALLRRPTALKLLPRSRAGAQAIARFEQEVQMTSRLTHPCTIQIYDYGRAEDGTFYYAMELIEGLTLDELVREEGAQPAGRVARILADVCGSLAEAHGAGLIHRDIKPQNVMLCARAGSYDVVKVLDFGLVKSVSDVPREGDGSHAVAGTPAYMAPEAFEHPESVGPASDLYAVGALGYFLLTGAPVFPGETPFELFGQHLHAWPVPPSERAGRSIPPALERLVLACLAKSPEERPESAEALRALLAQMERTDDWSDEDAAEWWKGRPFAPRPPKAEGYATTVQAAPPRTLRITRA
jgi:serine/threonine-protein kinase